MKPYNNHKHPYYSQKQQKNNKYHKNRGYTNRNRDGFSEQNRYQNNYSNSRHDFQHPTYNNNHQNSQGRSHISLKNQFLRALFGVLSALGFGAFWYGLIQGIQSNLLVFVVGIFLVFNVFLHLVFVIKKQIKNSHR